MTKEELRNKYLDLRNKLSAEEVENVSLAIADKIKSMLPFPNISVIHVFLQIERFNEVNLWPLIHWIWENHPHIKVVVPKSNFKTRETVSCLLTEDTELTTENYGIPEPKHPIIIDSTFVDVVITPLLVCDNRGYRVGYGKGFYDAFFNTCNPMVEKIGVGFFAPVEEIEDVGEWDVRLDGYIY